MEIYELDCCRVSLKMHHLINLRKVFCFSIEMNNDFIKNNMFPHNNAVEKVFFFLFFSKLKRKFRIIVFKNKQTDNVKLNRKKVPITSRKIAQTTK